MFKVALLLFFSWFSEEERCINRGSESKKKKHENFCVFGVCVPLDLLFHFLSHVLFSFALSVFLAKKGH